MYSKLKFSVFGIDVLKFLLEVWPGEVGYVGGSCLRNALVTVAVPDQRDGGEHICYEGPILLMRFLSFHCAVWGVSQYQNVLLLG